MANNIKNFTIFPIGKAESYLAQPALVVEKKYWPALKQLEKFSHLLAFWYVEESLIASDESNSGWFAKKGGRRPNPLIMTTCRIVDIDFQQGRITVNRLNIPQSAILIDIKAYIPVSDRVKKSHQPDHSDQLWFNDTQEKEWQYHHKSIRKKEQNLNKLGKTLKKQNKTIIQLDPQYVQGLTGIDQYSHVQVLFWFDRLDGERFRKILQCHPPYHKQTTTGVFASRSPVRPNPIGLSTIKIHQTNEQEGWLEVDDSDFYENTPILDIQPYIPAFDRVSSVTVPPWLSHWPAWYPERSAKNAEPDQLFPADVDMLSEIVIITDKSPIAVDSNEEKPIDQSANYSEKDKIAIIGASKHNLKNISLNIPKNQLVVITGVSGSGKSSLAFDTIYAEGQRGYLESLTTSERQLFHQLAHPQVKQIKGLIPTVAIEQKSLNRSPRSTVGTITGIYNLFRVLFAEAGLRHCPQCGRAVKPVTISETLFLLKNLPVQTQFNLYYQEEDLDSLQDILIGKYTVPDKNDSTYEKKIHEAIKQAFNSKRTVLKIEIQEGSIHYLSPRQLCVHCDQLFFALSPSQFSFNSPDGMCSECNGLGVKMIVNPDQIISSPELSLLDGASRWWGKLKTKKRNANWLTGEILALADDHSVDLSLPWNQLPEEFKHQALYGNNGKVLHYEYHTDKGRSGFIDRPVYGAIHNINRLLEDPKGKANQQLYLQFLSQQTCPVCQGERLALESRLVTLGGKRLPVLTKMTIQQAYDWLNTLPETLTVREQKIAFEAIQEITKKLNSLIQVGLHYLNLDRATNTLSGGEAQRVRLSSQLAGHLSGLLYILDEPTIGLHPRDHQALIRTMKGLKNNGNSVLVVEHDDQVMKEADWIIDMGPQAGSYGGELVGQGTLSGICQNTQSLTAAYLNGNKQVGFTNPKKRTPKGYLTIKGAKLHNLKNIEVSIPLGVFTCFTGVSGSGKSSLIIQTLYPALAGNPDEKKRAAQYYKRISGSDQLDKVIHITQEAIGRTPRSNPATYTGVFDEIRKVFASTPGAKENKYQAGHFSFNNKEGYCTACEGNGKQIINMHFLPDVWITCPECQGSRYRTEILDIVFQDKNIAQVLDMEIREAIEYFTDHPKICHILNMLCQVGLDYIKLGQSGLTLSGGEAQRIKLAKELCRPDSGNTLYILDEPTTGLHFEDMQKLLTIINQLVEHGNTVVMIEHNTSMIRNADWIIDLGPEGGDAGGEMIAAGTPEDLKKIENSITGQFL
ncbi:MAG: excinuclease ABC subunit UvrA [Spirochaetes bacterium]|nr:excinuclease ABC subunit UvrA [Spirochaetota bacterium]